MKMKIIKNVFGCLSKNMEPMKENEENIQF